MQYLERCFTTKTFKGILTRHTFNWMELQSKIFIQKRLWISYLKAGNCVIVIINIKESIGKICKIPSVIRFRLCFVALSGVTARQNANVTI